MNNLQRSLFINPPKENSGSSSSNRFDYQKNWSICKLIELHSLKDDYLLVLEFHDDVIVFNSSDEKTYDAVDFYQVKTSKSPNWTLNKLISRKKSTKKDTKGELLSSILGKLYAHINTFGNLVKSLNFVTNNNVKITLKNNQKGDSLKSFCCNEICTNDLTKINDALKKEFSLDNLEAFKDKTFFYSKELSIDQHENITKGELSTFIDKKFPNIKYNLESIYKTLIGEVKRKNNYEHKINDFQNLKRNKGISRADFEGYLDLINRDSSFSEIKNSIESRLNSEGVSFTFIKEFHKNATQYEVDRMNYNNKSRSLLEKEIAAIISKNKSASKLFDCIGIVLPLISNKLKAQFDITYIQTVILFKLYE